MADNLKNFGSFIPGYRPGKRTADYLEKVMVRITYVGAGFLALVAIIPTLVSGSLGVDYVIASFYGGTSLLIAVSVAFDLVQKIDSHLVMRNYKGLLGEIGRESRVESRVCQKRELVSASDSTDSLTLDHSDSLPCASSSSVRPALEKGRRPSGSRTISASPICRPARCCATPSRQARRSGAKRPSYMKAGQLVPDDVVVGIVGERLEPQGLCPRLPVRRLSAHGAAGRGARPDAGRAQTCRSTWCWRSTCRKSGWSSGCWPAAGRTTTARRSASGSGSTISLTEPLLDYYRSRGVLRQIDGDGTPDEVFERIQRRGRCGRD